MGDIPARNGKIKAYYVDLLWHKYIPNIQQTVETKVFHGYNGYLSATATKHMPFSLNCYQQHGGPEDREETFTDVDKIEYHPHQNQTKHKSHP